MKITFLGQGYEPESVNAVGNHLMKNLATKNFHSFFGVSAFASEAGVVGLGEHIIAAKHNFKLLTLIVGIDQEGTSKEALSEILALDINSYIFYQKEPPIFHPKIYLFEGEKETKLIVGSSNLTARGLFGNVESSLLIEFASDDKDGEILLIDLKKYYSGLFNFDDPNLFKITEEIIEDFIAKGVVPNETLRLKKHSKKTTDTGTGTEESGIAVPKRKIAHAPSTFRSKPRSRVISKIVEELEIETVASGASIDSSFTVTAAPITVLVWQSGPLTQRDLNIPDGENTNATGSMLFKKGLLEGIDQRHYFRDEVFASLNWTNDQRPASAHLERATGQFRLIIRNIDRGVFPLLITHNPRTDVRSYEQKNSMTSVSWGAAKEFIANPDLIGASANLFRDVTTNDAYTLVIE